MGNPKTKSSNDILTTNFEVKSSIKLLTIFVLIVSMLVMGLVPSVSAKEEQPVMATDVYHGSTSEFSELQKIAIDKGWSVISFDEPITLKLLVEKKVSLFVTSIIEAGYTDQELEELKAYVAKGGNIVIQFPGGRALDSESPPEAREFTRELSRLFGIDILTKKDNLNGNNIIPCDYSYCELTIHVSYDHPLFEGVSKVNIGHTATFYYLSVESPAVVILSAPKIPSTYNSQMALFEDESGGRVIVYSRSIATSGRSAEVDNSIFLNNILKWISPPDKKPPIVPKEIVEVIDPTSYWVLGMGIALITIAIILMVTLARRTKKLKKG